MKNKKLKKFILTLCFALIIVLILFVFQNKENKWRISLGDKEIIAEIVDTPKERIRGLSGRKNLGENEGMIFVFSDQDYREFWMKDMNFSIDIFFVDKNNKIIDVLINISPDTFPAKFKSRSPAKYAIETKNGSIKEPKLLLGSYIFIENRD